MPPMNFSLDHLPAAVRGALHRDMTIDITTIGRRSGEPRRIEIWFVAVDDAIYITGTPGPRDWLANLRADPRLTFHLKESVEADLPARAVEVTNPDERRRVLTAATTAWYRNQGDDIDRLVAEAPMVRISFD